MPISAIVGEDRAKSILVKVNDKKLEEYYLLSKESSQIAQNQRNSFFTSNINTSQYNEGMALSYVLHEDKDKEGEKVAKRVAYGDYVSQNKEPEKENSYENTSEEIKNKTNNYIFDYEKLYKNNSDSNMAKTFGELQNPSAKILKPKEYASVSVEQTPKTENTTLEIDDFFKETTKSGVPVQELAYLVGDIMGYNSAKLDGVETKEWKDLPVGYSLHKKRDEYGKKVRLTDEESRMLDNLWIWKKENIYKNEGLDIAVYSKKIDGKKQYVIVNAGSEFKFSNKNRAYETAYDWSDNLSHLFFQTNDTENSIAFAIEFVKDHPDDEVVFVGFSKGGAEAAANAVATGKDAILFNPASPNLHKYDLDFNNYNGKMVSYIIDGEALSETSGKIWKVPGEKRIIKRETEGSLFDWRILFGIGGILYMKAEDSINKHGLSNFKK